jgi:mRNA-degrading endonuclease RelE of RelBE toxin-antitoxin system
MAVLRISSIFAEAATRLPKEAKAKLPKAFMLLINNPRHPSLQVKKIEGATRHNVYECRLDQSWRIILQETGETTFDLVYVGAHDEAINYGARLRESGTYYGTNRPITERLKMYLAGDDTALEFTEIPSSDLEKLGWVDNHD